MAQLFSETLKPGVTLIPRPYQDTDHDESFRLWDGGEIGVLSRIFTGGGKCLGRGTPVLMFDGSIKPVEQIVVGDRLMGPDSTAREVLTLAHGIAALFRIIPSRGEPFVVNGAHILTLKATRFSSAISTICGVHSGETLDVPIQRWLTEKPSFRHIMKGFRVGVVFSPQSVPIDPYFFGVWLGDGTFGEAEITTADEEVVQMVGAMASKHGLGIKKTRAGGISSSYAMTSGRNNRNFIRRTLNALCPETKFVPAPYKINSIHVRREVLAGLLDSDGYLHHNGFDFISMHKSMSSDVAFLARSLGLAAYVTECQKSSQNGTVGTYWRVSISGDCSQIPTRILRKAASPRRQKKDHLSFGFKVQAIGPGEYFGFNIDGDGRFLLGDFTVTHNTPVSCMKIRTWLDRDPNNYAMVISYERDLVWQFAQEIYDFIGIEPGIEMADEKVNPADMPRVIVASRATLLPPDPITNDQSRYLLEHGIDDVSHLTKKIAAKMLRYLANDGDEDEVRSNIDQLRNAHPNGENWTRLHKFDWQKNWLLFFDEAHRHAHSLKSVGHIVDWFGRNPASRRSGLTATPKRGDGISIGHKMFPGVAIDYPLYHVTKPCAVKQGWAVPYVQRYIEVEGVDFKNVKKIAGDFDKAHLELILGEEAVLAKLVQPLLDLVGERRTLIFSPGVDMAHNVALFINARSQVTCPECGVAKWYPKKLIGDGAQCPCGRIVTQEDVTKDGEQAKSMHGCTPTRERKQVYQSHQAGKFQFLSVCGLCREGYNDPDVSCIAIFRPVSKKASSLAEQMKGRGCRPCRAIVSILNELLTAEERLDTIAKSNKPDCLIVDLVGITGLADCASTAQIYADGLEDEVADRAAEILADEAGEEPADVEEAIQRAQEEIKAEREANERRKREEAEARAKADAEVKYTQHKMGYGSQTSGTRATDATYRLLKMLGMNIQDNISQGRAGKIIDQLKLRKPFEDIAKQFHIENWKPESPSEKQLWRLGELHIQFGTAKTGWDATQIIGAWKDPKEYEDRKMKEIHGCADKERLHAIAIDLSFARLTLHAPILQRLIAAGVAKKNALPK